MTTLNFKQLMTISELLNDARNEQATKTYRHDELVKNSLDGNKEKLNHLIDIQEANYARKTKLENTLYVVQEMIKEYGN